MGRVTTRVPRTRVDVARDGVVVRPDTVAVEEPLEVRVGEAPVTTTMRTPGDDFDLALGHLLTEGMIGSAHDVATMMHCTDLGPDGSPRMWLAQALEVVDPTTVVVKLRQGHSFSDGKPVTAEDVKFSFDYLKRWDAAYFKKYLEKLASVDVVDPTTVRFKLTEAYAPFIINTLGQVLILPKHVWGDVVEKTGIAKPQDFRNMPLVSSGPYTLRYWREGQEISLQRRADHFAKPASDLLIVVFGSAELVGAALKKGDIDVSFQPIVPTVVKEFAAEKNVKLIQARSNGHMSMRYNTARPALASKALRQAMAHAIPYEAIIEEVLGGDAGRSATPIVPVNAFWHNASIPLPAYDIDKAKAILKAAGYSWGPDGALRAPAK